MHNIIALKKRLYFNRVFSLKKIRNYDQLSEDSVLKCLIKL